MVNKLWENRLFMIFSVIIVLTLVVYVVTDLWDWPQGTEKPAPIILEGYFYTEADSGSIQIPKGKEFQIFLESNQTTGFQWAVQLDSNFIDFKGKNYIENVAPGGQIMGAGGQEKFRFVALQVGQTEIILTYARPWESVQPEKTLIYNITITE